MMRNRALKGSRRVISLLLFLLFLYVFVDSWTQVSKAILPVFLYLQFIPSLLDFLSAFSSACLGFVIIIALTLLFGRIYCSSLCPLGTLQDIFSRLARLFRKKKRPLRYHRPYNILRYSILFGSAVFLLLGSITALLFLDPYSIAGRISTHLVRPLFIAVYNLIVSIVHTIEAYALLPLDVPFFHPGAFVISLSFLLLIIVLAAIRGRLFCNTLCPVGTLLGLFSRFSLYRIRIKESVCNRCGNCGKVCKAQCIDVGEKRLDFSRCVGCMNCLTSCPEESIDFYLSLPLVNRTANTVALPSASPGRRTFLQTLLGLSATVSWAQPLEKVIYKTFKPEQLPKRKAITPPGSFGRSYFHDRCTACHLCVSQCPTMVIQPAWTNYGLSGILQPLMNYPEKYCLYECNICGLVCPTGAILPVSIEEKKRIQIGKARFIEELCIVVTKGTACGACSEHCPTKACDMVPYKDKLTIPKVDQSICIGCGACEHPCPTEPRSIVVDENIIHLTAGPPRKKVVKQTKNESVILEEDFPF